jgi:hypothetical protein
MVTQEEITKALLQQDSDKILSPQSVEDALSFLLSAHILREEHHCYHLVTNIPLPPRLLFLKQLMLIYKKELPSLHMLDPFYLLILNEIFIKRDIIYVEKLHTEVNALRAVKQIGGINHEKLQAWRRVMTYLGIGQRVGAGFYCMYQPNLLLDILHTYDWQTNSAQYFFENHCNMFLPFETMRHDLAKAVIVPLTMLHEVGHIILRSQQDTPQRAYGGAKRFQYIAISHEHERKQS